jgi:hemolysin activation/secretion protein
MQLPEGLRIQVHRFRLSGNRSLPTDELHPLLREWEGRELGMNEINEAAGAITRAYQARGHLLSYAYLPEQKIERGEVEIAVVEGRIGGVQVVAAQDVRLDEAVITRHVDDLTDAPQTTQPELERRVLLLNDLPGVVARAAFTPGALPGTADMVLSVAEDEALAAAIDFSNHGGETSGRYRLGLQVSLRNLFAIGDGTRIRVQTSDYGRLINGSLTERVPLGGQGWVMEAGVSHLTYEIAGGLANLRARGEADDVTLALDYPIWRGLQRNLRWRGALQRRELKDIIALVGSHNTRLSQRLETSLAFDAREWLPGGLRSAGSVALSVGRMELSAGADNRLGVHGDFGKVGVDLSHQQLLATGWSVSGRWQAQYSDGNLDSSEKFSLAGPYAVRAYASGEAAVDRGYVAAAELRHSIPMSGGTLAFSLFHDIGYGIINVAPLADADNRVTLSGTGLGATWDTGGDLTLNLTAAWRGHRLPTVDADRRPRIFFWMQKAL